jgi:hypothetical protein
VFVALNESIYYSENFGDSWSQTSIDNTRSINYLTKLDSNILAVTDIGIFLFKSNNEWFNLHLDYNSSHLVVSDTLLLASTYNGIFKTTFNEMLISDIKKTSINNFFDIYPNPFSSILNIKVNDFVFKQLKIGIYNLSGILVYSVISKTNESDFQLNLGRLNEGVYLIQIFDGEQIMTKRIIKLKN